MDKKISNYSKKSDSRRTPKKCIHYDCNNPHCTIHCQCNEACHINALCLNQPYYTGTNLRRTCNACMHYGRKNKEKKEESNKSKFHKERYKNKEYREICLIKNEEYREKKRNEILQKKRNEILEKKGSSPVPVAHVSKSLPAPGYETNNERLASLLEAISVLEKKGSSPVPVAHVSKSLPAPGLNNEILDLLAEEATIELDYRTNYSNETKNVNDKIKKISENVDPKISTYVKKNDKGLGVYANKDFKKNDIVAFYLVKIYDLNKIGEIYSNYLIDLNDAPNLHKKYKKNKTSDIVGDICDKSFQEPIKLNDWLTAFWGFLCNEPSREENDNCKIELKDINTEIKNGVIIDRDIKDNASEYYLASVISKKEIEKDSELTWCYGDSYKRDYDTSCIKKKVLRKTIPHLPVSSDDKSKGDEHELDGRKKINKSRIHRTNNSKNYKIKYKKKLPSKKRLSKKRSSKKRSSKKRSSNKRSCSSKKKINLKMKN